MNEDVRKVVYQQLIKVCPNVYYEDVPHDAVLPYIVYSFPSNGRLYRNQSVSDLQVEIYDVDRDGYNVSVEIDRTVSDVERLFDYQSFSQGETSFWFRLTGRTALPFPDDVNIWSRRLVFETRIYKL